jgi:hypothetical protein
MANYTKRDMRREELIARVRAQSNGPLVVDRLLCACGEPAKYELNLATGPVALYCGKCLPKDALVR